MMKKKIVLFDFDGVIADSLKLAFEVNKVICPDLTKDDYQKRFEGNINDWEKVSYGHSERCRHHIHFFDEYIPEMKNQAGLFVGMEQVIRQLSESYNLIIVSSTLTSLIQGFIKKYDLSRYFVEIMGNDISPSKSTKIKMILHRYSTKSKRCIFITDTVGDIREAWHVGVKSIGVTWGLHKKETLIKGIPIQTVQEPKNLPLAIAKYFTR